MPTHKLGEVGFTCAGWPVIEFRDSYDRECSLQTSSNIDVDALWLGVNGADPRVLAREAASHGVKTEETVGWVPYPIPDGVLLSTRMHLDRQGAENLIAALQYWLDTGKLEIGEAE
jgi:hypothetical protein